jgi:hypothetical protein
MERLDKTDLKGDALKEEIERCSAITDVAKTIIRNGSLFLEAVRTVNEFGDNIEMSPLLGEYKLPPKLSNSEKKEERKRQLVSRHALGE